MAEFCLQCWNKLNERNEPAWKYVLSRELDFCEECQQWKRVIIMARGPYYWCKIRYGIFGFIKDRHQREFEKEYGKSSHP